MIVAALLYDGFTMLDVVGPLEVFSMMPDTELRIVAREPGLVWPDNQALPFVAPFGIDAVHAADVLLVPGGPGCFAVAEDPALITWIREVHKATKLTCSVCSGSAILGAAGLLEGMAATSHWTMLPLLETYGATPVSERWVRGERIITAAGVSAGIDMALEAVRGLAGEAIARAIQLALEYDPHPPIDSGDHTRAAPEVRAAVLDGTIAFDRRARARPAIPGEPQAN